MNPNEQAWQRLAASARRAPAPPEASAPYGFAVRVAALGLTADHRTAAAASALALRAAGMACLLALGVMAANYTSVAALFQPEAPAPAAVDDPVGQLVDDDGS